MKKQAMYRSFPGLGQDGYYIRSDYDFQDDEKYFEYIGRFGDIVKYKFGQSLEISNKSNYGGTQFSCQPMCFHQDAVLNDVAADFIFLQCVKSPSIGGESILSDGLKLLEVLQAEYPDTYDFLCDATVIYKSKISDYYKNEVVGSSIKRKFIVSHPITKKLTPYFALYDSKDKDPNYTALFEGISKSESNDIMILLDSILRRKTHLIELKLKTGDLLIVDNFRMLHGRNGFYKNDSRVLKRVQIRILSS